MKEDIVKLQTNFLQLIDNTCRDVIALSLVDSSNQCLQSSSPTDGGNVIAVVDDDHDDHYETAAKSSTISVQYMESEHVTITAPTTSPILPTTTMATKSMWISKIQLAKEKLEFLEMEFTKDGTQVVSFHEEIEQLHACLDRMKNNLNVST
jgi:hypothetical protein